MSPQLRSNESSPNEMTLAKWAARWRHGLPLQLYRRALAASNSLQGKNDAMPDRVRIGIEKRAETSPDVEQLLAAWLKHDAREGRRILGLRELDTWTKNCQMALRSHAIARVRASDHDQIQTRYRRIAKIILKHFAERLAVECLMGATVRARHINGTLQILTHADIHDGELYLDEGCIVSGPHKWFSVCISLPVSVEQRRQGAGDEDDVAPASDSKTAEALQAEFDAEKRRRINDGKDHKYDAMTMWARSHLEVDSKTADELWTNRSDEFRRGGGRLEGRRKNRVNRV